MKHNQKLILNINIENGGRCGSVGRAVTSDIRGPRFESSHQQTFIRHLFVYWQLYWKDENKEKEARNGPFFKIKMSWGWSNFKNSEIIHSDLIKLVTWLAASNHTVLFHNRVITLLWKFYLRCRNDLYIMY